ncbi:MAG TPA: methylenetetrahydrofolate reductase [Candidatus Thioglobus sp.]|jgi:methylenetetrahydrofolate reductase (NADPH)|nr:methylenetetrahydrofolate reductase [Candidatus Thioglobus sp.]
MVSDESIKINPEYVYHPGNPLPKLEGHVSRGRFERVLKRGEFAVTTELAPPDSADRTEVFHEAAMFDHAVDAINATDGSGANCHMSSVAVCALLAHIGYSPILQISCRDKNRIAIQGDILGAAAMGVCNVLALTGDDVSAGDQPEAKRVFDLDSISLLTTIQKMRDESTLLSGRRLTKAPAMFAGSTINPFVPPVESRVSQMEKKIDAGAQFIQTQYCFDMPMLKDFMAEAVDRGLTERAFILPGVGTLASANTAKWLRSNVPGVHIPDSIIKRLEGAENQKKEGQKICVELMQQVKELEGVSGVHVMAYKQEQYVAEMVKDSGVLGDRKPWAPKNEY